MTHTFTPPKTFPHEYTDGRGYKCVVTAQAPNGHFIGYIDRGKSWAARDWDSFGKFGIQDEKPDLRDLPKVTSTWQNQGPEGSGLIYHTRKEADYSAAEDRIAVLRRDTIDGVTTCELEPI